MSVERGAQFQQEPLPGMERADSRVRQPAKRLTRVADDTQLSMVMPKHALTKALDEDRFKNTFEASGSGIGMGSLSYMQNRRYGERALFGIPEDAPGEQRPIYGFLREKNNIEYRHEDESTPAPAHYLQHLGTYGNALVDIRPPKHGENVTYTESDSLNSVGTPDYAAPEQLHRHAEPGGVHDDDYTEVQWHDRPSPKKDIQAVHFRTGLPRASDIDFEDPDLSASMRQKAEQVKQHARDLRISGLKAPVHHWQEKAVQQPSLFNPENVGMQWGNSHAWMQPTVTKHWEHKQV